MNGEWGTFSGPLVTPNPSLLSHPIVSPLQCGTIDDEGPNEGLTERSLQDAQRLYLMNDVVQPESVDPLVMQDDVRFSNLVVDIVQGMDTLYHVMYISTGEWRRREEQNYDLFSHTPHI